MKIDFHSHILPGIDDGAKNIDESIEILRKMAKDNIDVVIATPHFYCDEQSIHRFIERRDAAYQELKPYLEPEFPRILLGAEVLYNPILTDVDDISRLCIQGTNFMLLEMPYKKLTNDIIYNVEQIASYSDVKLVIAHIERYLNFTSFRELTQLMQLEVLGQVNAISIFNKSSRRDCFKLIKKGFVHVLGSDYHRLSRSHVMIGEVTDILVKKFGGSFISDIEKNGKKILSDVSTEEILVN